MSPSCYAWGQRGPCSLTPAVDLSLVGAWQDGALALAMCTWSLRAGCLRRTGPKDSVGIPKTLDCFFFPLHTVVMGPGPGLTSPCATLLRGPCAGSHLPDAALSALPPRVPRGRHEPVPPFTIAGWIGCTRTH